MTKTLTQAAQAAQQIRSILKEKFPDIKFCVKSTTYSMGSSVKIRWANGPTNEQVNQCVNNYEYSNHKKDIPQAKFVFCRRDVSDGVYQQLFNFAKGYFLPFDNVNNLDEYHAEINGTARNFLYRTERKIDLRQELTQEIFRKASLD